MQIPIGRETTFEGVVDIIRRKAIRPAGEGEIPADMQSAVDDARLHLMEAVAETDEELLNSFLENMELSDEQLLKGLKQAVANGEIRSLTLMAITISADHRIVDGATAAQFANAVRARLENLELWKSLG